MRARPARFARSAARPQSYRVLLAVLYSQAFELTCAAVRSSVPVLNIVCVSFFAENASSVYVPPPIRLAQPVEFVILCGIPQWGKRGHTLTSVYRERPSVAWMNTVRRE